MKPFLYAICFLILFINIPAFSQTKGWICLRENGTDTLKLDSSPSKIFKSRGGHLYVTGNFLDSLHFRYVANWNDTSWSEVDSSPNTLHAYSIITDICDDKEHNLYAATSFDGWGKWYVAKWNGSTWTAVGTGADTLPSHYNIYAICADTQGNIYVSSLTATPNSHNFISRWNGNTWTEIANDSMLQGPALTMCADNAGNIYAAGFCADANGKKYVAKWDGSTWSELGTGTNALNANERIKKIYCDTLGNVYATGKFTNDSGYKYVAMWNGNTWTEVGGLNGLRPNDEIMALYADNPDNVYAAGAFTNAAGRAYLAQWDGTSWTETGAGTYQLGANGQITTIARDQYGDIYVGGGFYGAHGEKYIAKYTDVSFLAIGELPGTTGFTVFPNPTENKVIIQLQKEQRHSSYYVYDIKGTVIKKGQINTRLTEFSLDDIAAGTYILQVGDASKYRIKIQKR